MIAALWENAIALAISYRTSILLMLFVLLSVPLHEGSHWLVGRIWTSDLSVVWRHRIVPEAVSFHSPFQVPPHAIRLSAMAPILFYLPITIFVFSIISDLRSGLILSLPFSFAAIRVILSPGDLLAILFPTRFQEYAVETDAPSHVEVLHILAEEIRP